MPGLRLTAPAKINLFLHITGKRADGYHLLESLAVFSEFGDVIELSEAAELSLSIDGPFATLLEGDNDNNLMMRAARALQKQCGVTRGAKMRLHKRLPMGAGLGGGSSDAAAVIKGLVQLWQLSPGDAGIMKLALPLGSDVPVCMAGRSAWVSGVGEQVTPVELSVDGGWVVLVNPGVPLLTADVYRRFPGKFSPASAPILKVGSFSALLELMQSRHNDLEQPAIALMPVIEDILAALRATSGCAIARMSGSGATCFALYGSKQEADAAAQALRRAQSKWWVQATELLG